MQDKMVPKELNEHHKYLTAAYEDFKDRLCYKYLVSYDSSDFELLKIKLNMVSGNSTPCLNCCFDCVPCCCLCSRLEVPVNHFALVINQSDRGEKTLIYGPGFHNLSYFSRLQGVYDFQSPHNDNLIVSEIGDLKIAKVNQGCIVNFECSGQNIILPPGIHRIEDPLIYISTISLDSFFI